MASPSTILPKYSIPLSNIPQLISHHFTAQATVVTADGSILTANDTENTDLFWAIRGGGCNFGVVTEFVLKLHVQRRMVYAGVLVFPHTVLESLAKFSEDRWDKGLSEKEGMLQIFTRGQDGNVSEQFANNVFRSVVNLVLACRFGAYFLQRF
jgi:FAD/FMN-containing dehydrogenase